tara:strand:- start:227 stop:640 length:414 start_codon:yes stop_codon:yes gene_type:complete
MTEAQNKAICLNAFRLPRLATDIEAKVGKAMLKAERRAGHRSKFPKEICRCFGNGFVDPESNHNKIAQVVALLLEQSPQSRLQLSEKIGCVKETAARRVKQAVELGLVRKVILKEPGTNNPIFVYEIIKTSKLDLYK